MFEAYVEVDAESARRAEAGLRRLAALTRVERRMLGSHMVEVAQMSPERPVFSRTLFSGKSLDEASNATVILLVEIRKDFHPLNVDASEIGVFANEISKCYVAKISGKAKKVLHFSIIIFLRDLRNDPVMHNEAIAYVHRSEIDKAFLEHYAPLADELGIGQFEGPIHRHFEKEYRSDRDA
jgi:hypothetical protein